MTLSILDNPLSNPRQREERTDMTRVSEAARITYKGSAPPPAENEVEYRSWLVYTAMREESIRKGFPPLTDENKVPGYRYQGSMQRVIEDILGDEMPSQADKDAYSAYTRPIYHYLRATRNAVCITHSRPVIWWVRGDWNDTSVSGGPQSDDGEHTEGGEVTISCSTCLKVFPDSKTLAEHRAGEHSAPGTQEDDMVVQVEGSSSMITCPDCGQKFPGGTGRHEYMNHRLQAHGVAEDCKYCGRSFADARAVGVHKRSKHPAEFFREKGQWWCRFCKTVWDKQQSYAAHMASHADEPGVGGHNTVVVVTDRITVPEMEEPPPAPSAPTDVSQLLEKMILDKVTEVTAAMRAEMEARVQAAEDRAREAEEKLARLKELIG